MPTISGLRRRGYTKECLNTFCNDIGATRNMNLVEVNRLEQAARVCLADVARRAMAVVEPVKVTISNFSGEVRHERGPSVASTEGAKRPRPW